MLLFRDWAPVESTCFLVQASHRYQCTHQQVQVNPPFISFLAEILLFHPHYLPANHHPESLLFLFLSCAEWGYPLSYLDQIQPFQEVIRHQEAGDLHGTPTSGCYWNIHLHDVSCRKMPWKAVDINMAER